MSFQIGDTVGGYEFLELLNTSGRGVTYKVRNTLTQRLEALKLLPEEMRDNRERVDRFLREVKIHGLLSHPNIAAFYHAMELGGQLIMTTELVEGESLEALIRRGPVPIETVVDYGVQALAGLAHAHANDVVHRNIAAWNLMITTGGIVKMTEFELAKAATDPKLTMTGVVVGCMDYISPEQVKGTATLDPRSDLYSLGAVLYEAATGQKMFHFKSQFEIMRAQVETIPTPPSDVLPGIPTAFDHVIRTALAKDPADRYQVAGEFSSALQQIPLPGGQTEYSGVPFGSALLAADEEVLDTGEVAGGQDSAGPTGSEQAQKTSDEGYAAEPVMKIIADSEVRELRTPLSSAKQLLLVLGMLVLFATAVFFALRTFL